MRFIVLVIAAAVATPFAAAALTSVTAGGVAAGSATIGACDANGFEATYATSGLTISAVSVTGIADPACEGGVLSVTITGGSGDSIAAGSPQTITADGDSLDNTVSVPVSPAVDAATAMRVRLVLEGP